MRATLRWIPLLVLLAFAGCKPAKPPPYQGKGRLVFKGPAREVIAAPGGGAIAWLAEPAQAKERGIRAPDHIYVGTATFFTGGDPITLGSGVATVAGTFFFSPTGQHVGAITGWDFSRGRGDLVVGSVAKEQVRRVAPKVSFFAFSKDGKWLGYVSEGTLWVEPADGGEAVEISKEIATFEFSPDGDQILARKRTLAGGQLLLASLDGKEVPRVLAARVNEYKWSANGEKIAYSARSEEGSNDLFLADAQGRAERVGKGVPSFQFSPGGKHLAFIGDTSPTKQFGDLFLLAEGGEAEKIGDTVTEFAFSTDEGRIAWLDHYRAESRGGTLKWREVQGGEAEELATNVPSFLWSPDGANLAYIQRVLQPVFSVDLFLAKVGGEEAQIFSIAKGVFGYSFTRDSERLFLRTECVRSGRVCELYSIQVDDPAATVKKVAGRIHTYETDPVDESYLMLTYARVDGDALDLGAAPADGSAGAVMLDRMVVPGTKLVAGTSPRIAYAVLEKDRMGVYVADIPEFERATAAH